MKTVSFYEDCTYGETKPAIRVLIDTPSIKEIRIAFRAGQTMKEHKTAYPIVIHVVEGQIDFGWEGNKHQTLEEGSLVALDAHVPHDLKAISDSLVRLSLNKDDRTDRVAGLPGKQ